MTLVGRVRATSGGRPLSFTADGTTATLSFSSPLQAWSVRRFWRGQRWLAFFAGRTSMVVRVKVPGLPTFTLLPRRSRLARLFLPSFAGEIAR